MNALPVPAERIRRWPVYASYFTALGMIYCFSTILIHFLAWLFPTMDGRGLLLLCALVILEAFFSYWLIKHLPTAQKQIVYYRGTELVVLLVALKLFTELRPGPASFWNNFLLWPVQFPFNIFTDQYLLTLLPALAAWQAGNLFAADLSLLGTDDNNFPDERLKTAKVRNLIQRRFLRLGILVVFLAAIPSQSALEIPLPVISNAVSEVIAYFVLGIILLSLTRFITLETTWWQAKLQVPVQIPRRWFAYSALILAFLVLLISVLPTNYGMGFFATLLAVYRFIYQAIAYFFGFILLLITLLARLLGKTSVGPQEQVPTPTPPPGQLPMVSSVSSVNWELVKSVVLWGSLVVLAFMALRQYIAFNRDLSEELRRFRPVNWFVSAWHQFIAAFRKTNRSVGTFIQNSLKRLRKFTPNMNDHGSAWEYVNPRRLNPRQKVIFYYLALVRRAKEAGLQRQEHQTPYEYATSLTTNLKEEKANVDAMTEAFIEARYSRHNIPSKTARRAESIWETIRHVLRNIRKAQKEERPKDE